MYAQERKQLETLEKELLERADKIDEGLHHEHNPDFAEQVTERENDDVLHNLDHETKIELQQVRAALKRMDEGKYGICASCEEEISKERLQALPYATLCIKCAEKQE